MQDSSNFKNILNQVKQLEKYSLYEGWITTARTKTYFRYFKENKLGKRLLLKKIYKKYKRIIGLEPEIEMLYNEIKEMGYEDTVNRIKRQLITQGGIKAGPGIEIEIT